MGAAAINRSTAAAAINRSTAAATGGGGAGGGVGVGSVSEKVSTINVLAVAVDAGCISPTFES